jgi:hypothetical protein
MDTRNVEKLQQTRVFISPVSSETIKSTYHWNIRKTTVLIIKVPCLRRPHGTMISQLNNHQRCDWLSEILIDILLYSYFYSIHPPLIEMLQQYVFKSQLQRTKFFSKFTDWKQTNVNNSVWALLFCVYLISAGYETLHSEIHKLINSISNKELWPPQWKE